MKNLLKKWILIAQLQDLDSEYGSRSSLAIWIRIYPDLDPVLQHWLYRYLCYFHLGHVVGRLLCARQDNAAAAPPPLGRGLHGLGHLGRDRLGKHTIEELVA